MRFRWMATFGLGLAALISTTAGCSAGAEDDAATASDAVKSCDSGNPRTKTALHVRTCTKNEGGAFVESDTVDGSHCDSVKVLDPGTEVEPLGQEAGDWIKVSVPGLAKHHPEGVDDNLWVHSGYLVCAGEQPSNGFYTFDIQIGEDTLRNLVPDQEVAVSVTIEGKSYGGVRLELHGATSLNYPKKSYRLKFGRCENAAYSEDDCEKAGFKLGKKPRIFDGIFGTQTGDKVEHIVLNASWIDPTFMRNKLTYDLIREMGGIAPRVGHGYVAFNGHRHGFYQVVERVNKDFLEARGLDKNGSLYKAKQHRSWDPAGDPFASTDNGPAFVAKSGPASRAELTQFFTDVHSRSMDDVGANILNLNDFQIFQMVHSFANNRDTFTKNYYLYKTPGGLWRMISWDADATFGRDWADNVNSRNEDDWLHGQWPDHSAFPKKWFNARNGSYLAAYQQELDSGRLTVAAMNARIDAIDARIGAAARAEAQDRGKSYDADVAYMKQAIQIHHGVIRNNTRAECKSDACQK